MKIALLHDYLNQFGGAERVLKELTVIFPEAPIFTLFYDKEGTRNAFRSSAIHTSFLQHIPRIAKNHRLAIPFMPLAARSLSIRDFDVVLSDSSGFAKGFSIDPKILHINYCYTPLRYAWEHEYLDTHSKFRYLKYAAKPLLSALKSWDHTASKAPHAMYAVSDHIGKKIKRYYGREVSTLYPPARTDFFHPSRSKENFYCAAGRLMHYKRFDLVVDAFNELGLPLKIIGSGPEYAALKARARNNIEFVGHVSDEELRDYYSASKALLFPQQEDFGLIAVEALSCGTPVIAFKNGGGPEEIVTHGDNGLFFEEQTKEALIKGIREFEHSDINPAKCRASALRFSETAFRKNILDIIATEIIRHHETQQ